MVIPRERDIVRFYTQLSELDAQEVINVSGRIDLTKWTPAKLLEVCRRVRDAWQFSCLRDERERLDMQETAPAI